MDSYLKSKVKALKVHHEHLNYLHCVAHDELRNSGKALDEALRKSRESGSLMPAPFMDRYELAIQREKEAREAMCAAYDSWSDALSQLAGLAA